MLIGYVNGTLDPGGRSSFEVHLSACPACRAELPVLEKLRAQVESLGEDVLSDHPTPAELVNSALPEAAGEELSRERRNEVRRHLAICPTCAEETRWVLGTEKARAPERPHPVTAPSAAWPMRAWKWAAATVALIVLALSLPFVSRLSPPRTGVGRIVLVEATQRASASSNVPVAAESSVIQLLFRVDLGPDAFPATFEVLDSNGRLVHRDTTVAAADLYRERFLLFTCSRDDCPNGRYVGRLLPADGTEIAVEYPFRIETEAPVP